ncbi:MAG TPA: DUF268 domain-containing protein [Pirellulales bacterium]|nr:DUF268 domain-containing protein [Pirellulales bacterium]
MPIPPFLRRWIELSRHLGFDPVELRRTLRGLPRFVSDYRALRRQYRTSGHEFPFGSITPHFADRLASSGIARGHYFHQDLLVASWIYADRPTKHVDIGSRIDGFVAHVAVFRAIEIFDLRPQAGAVHNMHFVQCDFTAHPFPLRDYADSASCLHALEHFGLGRYGDAPDYYGYRRGWKNLHQLLKPGGRLYFSVPMGPNRIEFNSQRVFSADTIRQIIDAHYEVERFAYVNDNGDLVADAVWNDPSASTNFGCRNGCAIFSLIKRPAD